MLFLRVLLRYGCLCQHYYELYARVCIYALPRKQQVGIRLRSIRTGIIRSFASQKLIRSPRCYSG